MKVKNHDIDKDEMIHNTMLIIENWGGWVNWVVCSKSIRSSPFETFFIFPGVESRMKFLKVQSALLRSRSVLWLAYIFLPLESADVSGAGMCDGPLRTSVWEASHWPETHLLSGTL